MSAVASDAEEPTTAVAHAIAGLAMRNIGPALMGGRIADIAIHPDNRTTWYVAVGSGGVWKTTNAGVTWKPIFDQQASYSIGCIAIDPRRPDVIWVGTGESVSGRHVAWGDGVYRSLNGGASWERMGLEQSEHIGQILIDPRNSDVIHVAAEGPLWSPGGERGVFTTSDGGATWHESLVIDDDTGVTKMAFAPDDPDVIYAAAYQRRRRVWSLVGGGPESGIHKSTDGGATWRKITEGLPDNDMGKIGIAVTPANPNIVYATIEADEEERGFYRSLDRGESWEKRSSYISGGTGPHYYQEIFASPVDEELVFQVDVFIQVTRDAGTSFQNLESGSNKHSDNHSIWIDPDNGKHLLVGTDAGLYETFDQGTSFRHFSNLPVSQFYRLALDNSEPFYDILGGAQDLGTLLGPSRTAHVDGVRNQDWSVPLGADGYHVAFDSDDPQTAYIEWQVGNVMRLDRRTMELQDVQPQPAQGDPPERWNWDCPIVVSEHESRRVYLASQRVWRSDDRGDSWTSISDDLTRNLNRYELAAFDQVSSVDALYDNMAMSQYSTISHLSESAIDEGVIYAGTDDGIIQVTDDGGSTWRRVSDIPDLPHDAFINNVEASRHDAKAVFVAADAHKNGIYTPFVFASTDRGESWQSIRGDLPDGTIVWAIEQDHIDPDLLFLGTEFGIYVSINHGQNWHKLTKDVPTISFRDIKLHRRDDDLVGASFGRGFFVLDDYSPLRSLDEDQLASGPVMFGVRDAWWYVPNEPMQAAGQPTLGSSAYRAPNPPFGATVSYYLADDFESTKKRRQKAEKELSTDDADIPFPGLDALWSEHVEPDPTLHILIRDASGQPIRVLTAETKTGLHRTTWDLRLSAPDPIKLTKPDFEPPWASDPRGPLAAPGVYSAELVHVTSTGSEVVSGPEWFTVKPTPATSGGTDGTGFQAQTAVLAARTRGSAMQIEATRDRIAHLRASLIQTPAADVSTRLQNLHEQLEELSRELVNDPIRERLSEPESPSIMSAVDRVVNLHWGTTQTPTQTQRASIASAATRYELFLPRLTALVGDVAQVTADVDGAGGPWVPR